MQISPEQWDVLSDKVKETHDKSLRVLAEIYETYKNAKINCEEADALQSTDPKNLIAIEEIRTKCKKILQYAEHQVKKSLHNLECIANVRLDTEQAAAIAAASNN